MAIGSFKLEYLKVLRTQLEYVDTVEEYEEIMEAITYLEDSLMVDSEMEYV